ncbi:MAG: THUMP domain-containing class I SAM-dependent methyltransferase [Pyrobaculum sp.]
MRYLVTTVPGLEDFVVEELAERLPLRYAHARQMSGRVTAEVEAEAAALTALRTAERFGIYLGGGRAGGLGEVVAIAETYLPEAARYMTRNTTVGIRTERVGTHPFTSKDVEREVGRWLKARGYVINLADPDVEINVDVIEEWTEVWITVEKRSLKRRPWRIYEHYASLNPIIAHAMARLARLRPGEVICDLTCGGGTIVVEAAELQPHARYLCVDISLRHVKGAARNAAAYPQVDVLWFDSTKLHKAVRPICVKYIFNPPYGFRLRGRIDTLYRLLGKAMRHMARGCATYVAITPRYRTFLSQVGGEVIFKRVIYQGGLYSHIIMGEICRQRPDLD